MVVIKNKTMHSKSMTLNGACETSIATSRSLTLFLIIRQPLFMRGSVEPTVGRKICASQRSLCSRRCCRAKIVAEPAPSRNGCRYSFHHDWYECCHPLKKPSFFHNDNQTSLDFESWEKPMARPRAKDNSKIKHKKNVERQMKQGDMRPRKCRPSPPIKFLFKQENKETSFSATKSFS